MTSEELAFRVQRGSKACFTELVNRFGPRLYNYFRLKAGSREDCEDLVQETLVKVYLNLHRYKPSRPFATWIFTIGTRIAVDHYRSQSRHRIARISHDPPAGGDPYDAAVRREENNDIWETARALPKTQFDALWLRYSEDMSVKEIAGVMGMTRVNVKVLLYRARVRLAGMQKRRRPIAPRTEEKRLQGILSH